MKIYYVPLDARWLERIRKDAEALREVHGRLKHLPIATGDSIPLMLQTISFCAGELETIRWSAFNRDVVVQEGQPLWHEEGD